MKKITKWFVLWLVFFFYLILLIDAKAQVTIRPETAQYFLEADDERFLLRDKDSLQTIEIKNLKKEVDLHRQVEAQYKADELSYAGEYNLLVDEHNKLVDTLDAQDERIIQDMKIKRTLAGAGSGAVIGATAGPLGGVIGFAIGAGIGRASWWFRKK
jgi:hypothetical protein